MPTKEKRKNKKFKIGDKVSYKWRNKPREGTIKELFYGERTKVEFAILDTKGGRLTVQTSKLERFKK